MAKKKKTIGARIDEKLEGGFFAGRRQASAAEDAAPTAAGLGKLKKMSKLGKAGLIGGGVLAAAEFAPGIIRGVRGSVREITGDDPTVDALLEDNRTRAVFMAMQQRKQEQLRRLQQENTNRILQYMPQVANQLLAGRKLPQGAVVIGGQPRTDLLDEVARQMGAGAFNQSVGAGP
jgi:hypothetical protein